MEILSKPIARPAQPLASEPARHVSPTPGLSALNTLRFTTAAEPIEINAPSKPRGVGSSIIHWIEDRVESLKGGGLVSNLLWRMRDHAVNFAFEKFGICPQYSYRGQKGLPTDETRASKQDLEMIRKLSLDKEPSLSKFAETLTWLLPRVPFNKPHGEPAVWCHIKRSYPFNAPTEAKANKSNDELKRGDQKPDFLRELERIMRDEMDVVLRVPIPDGTTIKRRLNHDLSFMTSDIGNEMIVPLKRIFPEGFGARPPNEKGDFLNSMVHYIRGSNGYRVPTDSERQLIQKIVAFRDVAYDLMARCARRIETLNDADLMESALKGVAHHLHTVAVHEGLVDPSRFPAPSGDMKMPHITLHGQRPFSTPSWTSSPSLYWQLARAFKDDLLKGTMGADLMSKLDPGKPIELHISEPYRKDAKTQLFPIEFRQAEKRIPAHLEVTEVQPTPDSFPYTWRCYE